MIARDLLDAYDAACAAERAALREYHRSARAKAEARAELLKALGGSQWEVSVVVNETVQGPAAPT